MPEKKNTTAVHGVTKAGDHVVGIGALRVLLVEEEGAWYAQGLEIDYVAQGKSIEDAKSNFEIGLHATIRENLKVHGTIAPLLELAPAEVWKQRLDPKATAKRFYYASVHEGTRLREFSSLLPFQCIDYLQENYVQ